MQFWFVKLIFPAMTPASFSELAKSLLGNARAPKSVQPLFLLGILRGWVFGCRRAGPPRHPVTVNFLKALPEAEIRQWTADY